MYKTIGWILGFIITLLFLILVSALFDYEEKYIIGAMFFSPFIFFGIVKFFHSLQIKKDISKSKTAEYFADIKTKEWLRKKVVNPMLYGRKKGPISEEKIPGILTFHEDYKRFNNIVGSDISYAIQLSYDIHDDNIESLWQKYIWNEYYDIIKAICELNTDFLKDLKEINLAYMSYMQIFSDGQVSYNGMKFYLKDLKEFHEIQVYRKNQKENLSSKLGISYDGLIEINKIIIQEQERLHDELEKAVNSFVDHYCNSF